MTCNQFISCVNCCFDALQELSGVYRRLDEAKQQIVGLQNEQAQLFAKCEAKTQSAAMATAEVVTLKQELADSCEHAQAVAADLASAQEVSCVASHGSCAVQRLLHNTLKPAFTDSAPGKRTPLHAG